MARIHFIYAGMPDNNIRQSPYSITRNLYNFLANKLPVIYHEWSSTGPIDLQPDDILLGHPNYPPDSRVQWAFRSGLPCRAKCLLHPLHTRRVEDNMPFDHLARAANKIFSICGKYWYDTIDQTPFAHWKPKIVRVDMAIHPPSFPFLRTQFHQPGHRRLIYIGSCTPNKNLDYMIALLHRIRNRGNHVELDWIGGSGDHPLARQPGVHVEGWQDLTPEVAHRLITNCDIFLNTSDSDANPTTLLESCAWGFIPICTPQSGYYNDPICDNISLDDPQQSVELIEHYLYHAPSDQLLIRAQNTRKIIEEQYNWDVFCNTIWNGLQEYL